MPGTFLAYPGDILQHPHPTSHGASYQWRLKFSHSEASSCPYQVFRVSILLDASLVSTFLLPPILVVHSSVALAPVQFPVQPFCTIQTGYKGKDRHQVLHSLLLTGELGKGTEP